MNNNFSIKFRKWDIIIVVITVIISSCLLGGILLSKKGSSSQRFVEIAYKNIILENLTTDLNELQDTKIIILKKDDYPSLLGDFEIELNKNKGVRAKEVTCPNHTCTKQGWINIPHLPIVCIPNDIRIEIVTTSSSEGGDATIQGVLDEKQILF